MSKVFVARRHNVLLFSMVGSLILQFANAHTGFAQDLPPRVRDRVLTAAVRIEVDSPRGTISGSGTVIHPAGYVLTNFHVVGNTGHSTGTPGVLHAPRVRVALTQDASTQVEDRFLGEMVRGNPLLDLAIVRIIGLANGDPLPAGQTFSHIDLADATLLPDVGDRVWACGFPAGIRTIQVTGGQVSGFDLNGQGSRAWIRTDAEFNPGNSGGALVDVRGRLIAVPTAVSRNVEPIELARPVSRIPDEWRTAIATGTVTAREVEGITSLTLDVPYREERIGDGMSRDVEMYYYRLPAGRPLMITVSPRLQVAEIASGRLQGHGEGQLVITRPESQRSILVIAIPRAQNGETPVVEIRVTPLDSGAPS